jgi:antitoxin component YwqK of YwqJK toxin-antitoxin module
MKRNLKINQYDKDGFRHGPWEDYYTNGHLFSKGEYKHSAKHGLWEYYYSCGTLWDKGEYKKSISIGLWYEEKFED